jgi:hypothetical protein
MRCAVTIDSCPRSFISAYTLTFPLARLGRERVAEAAHQDSRSALAVQTGPMQDGYYQVQNTIPHLPVARARTAAVTSACRQGPSHLVGPTGSFLRAHGCSWRGSSAGVGLLGVFSAQRCVRSAVRGKQGCRSQMDPTNCRAEVGLLSPGTESGSVPLRTSVTSCTASRKGFAKNANHSGVIGINEAGVGVRGQSTGGKQSTEKPVVDYLRPPSIVTATRSHPTTTTRRIQRRRSCAVW